MSVLAMKYLEGGTFQICSQLGSVGAEKLTCFLGLFPLPSCSADSLKMIRTSSRGGAGLDYLGIFWHMCEVAERSVFWWITES